jgi:hypothetical protein
MALETGMTVVDVSVIQPPGYTTLAATAQSDGPAAAKRDEAKRWSYDHLELHGYPSVPFTVECYVRLGNPALLLFACLGPEVAESARGASKSGFVAGAIRELSVGCAGAISTFTGMVMGSWLALWATVFAPAWPDPRRR